MSRRIRALLLAALTAAATTAATLLATAAQAGIQGSGHNCPAAGPARPRRARDTSRRRGE